MVKRKPGDDADLAKLASAKRPKAALDNELDDAMLGRIGRGSSIDRGAAASQAGDPAPATGTREQPVVAQHGAGTGDDATTRPRRRPQSAAGGGGRPIAPSDTGQPDAPICADGEGTYTEHPPSPHPPSAAGIGIKAPRAVATITTKPADINSENPTENAPKNAADPKRRQPQGTVNFEVPDPPVVAPWLDDVVLGNDAAQGDSDARRAVVADAGPGDVAGDPAGDRRVDPAQNSDQGQAPQRASRTAGLMRGNREMLAARKRKGQDADTPISIDGIILTLSRALKSKATKPYALASLATCLTALIEREKGGGAAACPRCSWHTQHPGATTEAWIRAEGAGFELLPESSND